MVRRSNGQFTSESMSGSNNPRWNSGIYREKGQDGYILIKMPDHPRSNAGGYVREHILIAEKALGKLLPKNAEVHHFNGTKNSGLLIICQDRAYHALLHQRERAYRICGHANWRKCVFCKQYDDPNNLIRYNEKGKPPYHKSCHQSYNRRKYHERKSK